MTISQNEYCCDSSRTVGPYSVYELGYKASAPG